MKYCMFSIREAHGLAPHEVFYGGKATIASAFDKRKVPQTFVNLVDEHFIKLNYIQTLAAENRIKAKEGNQLYYDRIIPPQIFEVGDIVYRIQKSKDDKTLKLYLGKGPYEIVEVTSEVTPKLNVDRKYKIVHLNKLTHGHIRL